MRMYPDLLESVQNVRPIAKSSAITYRYLLLRFASHVIATGISASEICDRSDPDRTRRSWLAADADDE